MFFSLFSYTDRIALLVVFTNSQRFTIRIFFFTKANSLCQTSIQNYFMLNRLFQAACTYRVCYEISCTSCVYMPNWSSLELLLCLFHLQGIYSPSSFYQKCKFLIKNNNNPVIQRDLELWTQVLNVNQNFVSWKLLIMKIRHSGSSSEH